MRKDSKATAYNERFGDSRGETLLKSNSVTSATVPCGIFSVPPPDRQAAPTLYAMLKGQCVLGLRAGVRNGIQK